MAEILIIDTFDTPSEAEACGNAMRQILQGKTALALDVDVDHSDEFAHTVAVIGDTDDEELLRDTVLALLASWEEREDAARAQKAREAAEIARIVGASEETP